MNPYRVGDTLKVVKDAMTTAAGGLKVIIARAECQLERQRRVKPETAARLKAGGRVEVPRFGVDPDVCTGDKSCMRFNGCPSLTLKDEPDPLRDDPVAHVDATCVGCGLCGEVAHAAVLCPSFYEARVVHNPGAWARGVADGAPPGDRLAAAGVMASRRPVSILIAALGGQGGGVLTEWIVGAAAHAGYPAQATSIPGVAQRTGATTYYVEVFPERAEPGGAEPVFSLYPDAGRRGRDHRLGAARGGTHDRDGLRLARPHHRDREHAPALLDRREVGAGRRGVPARGARGRGPRAEPPLRGLRRPGPRAPAPDRGQRAAAGRAVAASRSLPMTAADFEAAIREGGVAVERNVRGLKAGVELVAAGPRRRRGAAGRAALGGGEGRARGRASARAGAAFLALAARAEAEFPEPLHAVLGEALARLIDYQDARYAELFLERVRARARARPAASGSTRVFARRLAVWMTYEDAIRVADLKTRRGRFERIRRENGGARGLGPGRHRLPQAGSRRAVRHPARRDRRPHRALGRAALARRPSHHRPARPHHHGARLPARLAAGPAPRAAPGVAAPPARVRPDGPLGGRGARGRRPRREPGRARSAELGNVVKGYGEVRRRLSGALARFLDDTARPAIEADRRAGAGFARSTDAIRAGRLHLLSDEKG